MAAKFQYRGKERTVESVTRKSRQSGGLYDSYLIPDAQMFKAKEGENQVRILPATWKDLEKWGDGWEIAIYLHYNVGPDNGAYLCTDKMKNEPCPVCEARRKTDDPEEADQLRPSYRALCWVIDRENEKAGPQVWSIPLTLFKEINIRSVDKKTNTPILIDSPEDGYDLSFRREGSSKKTKYTGLEIDRDPTVIHDNEKIENKWLDYISEYPLPEILVFHDPDHIATVLSGKARRKPDDDGDDRGSRRGRREEPEDDRPSRRATREEDDRPSRRAAREDEPEDRPARRRAAREEEPEAEERPSRRASREEEPEAEERPTRRRSAREEEPEAEARPARRRGGSEESGDPVDDEPEERPRGGRRSAGTGDEDKPSGSARRALDKLRGAGGDEEPDEDRGSRRRPSREEPEEDARPSRRRPAKDNDEIPF